MGSLADITMPTSTVGQVIRCKAAVAWKPKEPLVIQEVQVDPPQAGEVRIKITHTSLCHSDMFVWENEGAFPRILGHEAAGIVESVGEGVRDLKEGDHVIPVFTGECGDCRQCKSDKTNLCAKLKVNPGRTFMLHDGKCRFSIRTSEGKQIPVYHFLNVSSFSEYTVVDAGCLAKVNPEAPLDKICLFSCGIPTGVGAAWNCAKVEKGSTVVIFGLGAVGLAVAVGSRSAGATRIIGIDINPAKFDTAKRFGVTEFINPRDHTEPIPLVVKELTGGGADYCFECVGNVDLMLSAFGSCHEGWGKTILVGIEVRQDKLLHMHPIQLFGGIQIRASTFGEFKRSQIPKLVDMYMEKTLEVDDFVTHELPFEQINDAFKLLKEGKSLRCVLHTTHAQKM